MTLGEAKEKEDKSYLVIIDDIWQWEPWEVIRKSLPKNNLSRIIMTTRVNAIAEKCRTENFSSVYEIEGLSMDAAAQLSWRIFEESCKVHTIPSDIHSPCSFVSEMTGGVPLSVICMSRAVADQLIILDEGQELDPDSAGCNRFHLAKCRALERFLKNSCWKPLVESFCLGYQDLPLHLKTCLLYCSLYPPHHIWERDNLTRMWIAERFVNEEEEAQSWADELVNMGLLRRLWASVLAPALNYEMDTMMLHFLRCKSQEYSFLYCLDFGSDISSHQNARRICRLTIQSYKSTADISRLCLSNTLETCSDYVSDFPLKQFEHLGVLHVHGNHLKNADLVDICGLPRLRCLSLEGAQINLIPKQVQRLQVLKTLNVSNTGILHLPIEIGELDRLEIMDISNTMVSVLPMEIGRLRHLKILNAKNSSVRELPFEIGDLQNLEVLDASNTIVAEIPREIGKLQQLKSLNISETVVAKLPTETFELQRLEMLDVSATNMAELPKDIKKLISLRTLNISNTEIQDLYKEIGALVHLEVLDVSSTRITTLPRVFRKLQHLKTLNINHTRISELHGEAGQRSNPLHVVAGDKDSPKLVKLLGDLSQDLELDADSLLKDLSIIIVDHHFDGSARWELPILSRFKVPGKRLNVPDCVRDDLKDISSIEISLWKLEEGDLEILRDMPKLQVLVLHADVIRRKPIAITDEGFPRLKRFCVDCRVPRVTFQKGAMPKLKRLEFKFYACRATEESMGISHLLSLQRVIFRSSRAYTSDAPGIRAIIERVSKEAEEHPNTITLSINGDDKVFPMTKSAGRSRSGECGVDKSLVIKSATCASRTSEIEEANE